jgi:hypothetical protein
MVHERIRLINSFLIALTQAITIAIRYSAVRFQGLNPNGYILFDDLIEFVDIKYRNETRILDYPLQQEKLVPCLSTTYAFVITFMKLDSYFHRLKTNAKVYLEQLPEVSDG